MTYKLKIYTRGDGEIKDTQIICPLDKEQVIEIVREKLTDTKDRNIYIETLMS